MSTFISPITFASDFDSVCSDRMASARRIDRPESIIVASCREKTTRSLRFDFWPN